MGAFLEETLEKLTEPQDNFEGYVLFWPQHQVRVKVKLDEYVTLHRIRTETSTRSLWEALSTGQSIKTLDDPQLPEDFRTWLRETRDRLCREHDDWMQEAYQEFERFRAAAAEGRKAFALATVQSPYRTALFLLLDGKDISGLAWKAVYPAYENPFQSVEEDA